MASLTLRSLSVSRLLTFSRVPTSHFLPKTQLSYAPSQTIGFRHITSPFAAASYSNHLNSTHSTKLTDSRLSTFGWNHNFSRYFVSAVPNSAAGGGGGSGDQGNSGGSGGGGSGSSGGSGDSNWSFLSWYMSLLTKHPVLTKALTAAVLTLIGDVVCQLAIDEVESLDIKRMFLFTFLGLALVGPTLHFWYLYLSKVVTLQGASGATVRLLLDQFLFSPIFIGVFLAALVTLEGRPEQVIPKLQQEWVSVVIANWQLWIPFQFLNFRFVPQQFQVLAANAIALVWNTILSFKAHKEILPK
ncbi:protein sym-1 [Mercurialis annua]|uniref:protein sym-1 n=1 Tax=Mercurialis annua TaxID=3986 RepID=UPI00215F2E03|nr:protein sym-1 [Mercurialis annua]XP_050205646.1 protein sym-1 [Mercurialis annua]XP_050205647.1 protein sym-1 [Mercurialis annua]XP_050205648.1 protein sym-1 [Mercurialis annua]